MFCFQCEQTSKGTGCADFSVCGKDEQTAVLQDLLVHVAKGVAQYAWRARQLGAKDAALDHYLIEALFTTVTNVNFDPVRVQGIILRGGKMLDQARRLYASACVRAGQTPESLTGPAQWSPPADVNGLYEQGEQESIAGRRAKFGPDLAGLQEQIGRASCRERV